MALQRLATALSACDASTATRASPRVPAHCLPCRKVTNDAAAMFQRAVGVSAALAATATRVATIAVKSATATTARTCFAAQRDARSPSTASPLNINLQRVVSAQAAKSPAARGDTSIIITIITITTAA